MPREMSLSYNRQLHQRLISVLVSLSFLFFSFWKPLFVLLFPLSMCLWVVLVFFQEYFFFWLNELFTFMYKDSSAFDNLCTRNEKRKHRFEIRRPMALRFVQVDNHTHLIAWLIPLESTTNCCFIWLSSSIHERPSLLLYINLLDQRIACWSIASCCHNLVFLRCLLRLYALYNHFSISLSPCLFFRFFSHVVPSDWGTVPWVFSRKHACRHVLYARETWDFPCSGRFPRLLTLDSLSASFGSSAWVSSMAALDSMAFHEALLMIYVFSCQIASLTSYLFWIVTLVHAV